MPTETNAPQRAQVGHYEFGPYRLEAASRTLFRAGEFVPLTPKAAETLLLLVQAAGLIVTKEQILERVWPGVVVEEGGIANNVSILRKLLKADFGEDGGIATIARQGYRFTGEVRPGSGEPAAAPASPVPVPAQPGVKETRYRETILVADIENKTGDPLFDRTIRQALALVLAQSPILEIVSDRKVHAALAVMQRPGTPVLDEVALEICQRTNAKAAITGSILALGDDYVIGLYARRGDNGDTIVSEQARARGKGEVLRALDQAALGLRAKLGESLASIRKYSTGFMDVATPSLDALKAYSMGRDAWISRGETASIPQLLQAIELDPNFLSAYSALALIYNNLGQIGRSVEYATRAHELRDRAFEQERYRIEGVYHDICTGDAHKSLDAWRACLQLNPRDSSAANNCGNMYMILGQFEKAERDLRMALDAEDSGIVNSNLTVTLTSLGRLDEAQAQIDHCFSLGYNSYFHHSDAYHIAFLRGDGAAMQRHFDAVMGRAGEEDYLMEAQANTEAFQGRHERARELTKRASDSALRAGSAEMAATWLAEGALRELECGRVENARADAEAALATGGGRNVSAYCAITLARTGSPERARELAVELDRDNPQSTLIQRYWLPAIRASLALGRGEWKEAVSALEPAAHLDGAVPPPFPASPMIPPYLRGLAYRQGGRPEEAAREFAKITSQPALVRNYVVYHLAGASS